MSKPDKQYDNNVYVKRSREKKKAKLEELLNDCESIKQEIGKMEELEAKLDIEKKKLRRLQDLTYKNSDEPIDLSKFLGPVEFAELIGGHEDNSCPPEGNYE